MPLAKVELYVTTYCGYCVRAKRLLEQKGVQFELFDVTNDPTRRQWLRQATGRYTVPQVFINGRSVGGFDDIAALERSGELDRLLAQAPDPAEPNARS
jgi:glutaredoxin 3